MPTQARHIRRVRDAPLIAAAQLDCLVWTCSRCLSRRGMWGIGLLAAAVATLAYLRGAELHPGLAGTQPGLLGAAKVTDDGRA